MTEQTIVGSNARSDFLCQFCFKSFSDSLDKAYGVYSGSGVALADETHKVLGHDAVVERIYAGLLKLVSKIYKLVKTVKLASLAESARPSVDRCHRVGGGILALKVAVVVTGNRAVSCFVFLISVGRNEHRGHHSK